MDTKFFTLLAAGPIGHLWNPFDMLPIIFVTQTLQPPPVRTALAPPHIARMVLWIHPIALTPL